MSQSDLYDVVYDTMLGVWSGALDIAQGQTAMLTAVREYLNEAWALGAQQCGILEGELTPEEVAARERFVLSNQANAGSFISDVYAHRDAVGGKLETNAWRVALWAQAYHHAYELSVQLACADRKAVWVYGDTVNHCPDCSRAAGRVHRRSVWMKYGWVPGSAALACGGFRCACQLVDTEEPAMPGHPPYLSGGF